MTGNGWKRSAVALVAVALTAAGCSSGGSSDSGSGGAPKSLAEALKSVHATAATRTELGWGDDGGGNGRDFDQVLSPVLGFSVTKQPFVLTVGRPPNQFNVVYGSFDPAAIGAKLQGLGYKPTDRGHGETQWLIRDDHRIDMSQQPEELAMTVSTYNVIRVSKDRLVYGGATSDLDAGLPAQSASLADDPVVGGVAKCLDKDATGMYDATTVPIAVGVGPNGTETICVSAPDDATAKKYGDAFTKAVTSGKSTVTEQPWSAMFTSPKVESLGGKGHVMRLTVTDVEASHPRLEKAMVTQDLMSLIGLPVPLGKNRTPAMSQTGSSSPDDATSSSAG
ncbi:hypothetical protein [Catenulispora subtropica]|uniref:Lipoprotein n=1 Tax=Catenulispora subtropica TaxID=450798 RepID=A0ABN2S197_9ACTN